MSWIPRSGHDSIEDLVWLPRLLQKARRCEERDAGRLIDGYCYGDNDFIDRQLLNFLHTDDTTVSSIVRTCPDDVGAAKVLVKQSGRTAEECRAFSEKMKRSNFNFILLDADEGRLPHGMKSSALRFVYNRMMMPIIYPVFCRAERKRSTQSSPRVN